MTTYLMYEDNASTLMSSSATDTTVYVSMHSCKWLCACVATVEDEPGLALWHDFVLKSVA